MLLLAVMSDSSPPIVDASLTTSEQLAGAARASIDADLSLEDFMRAAWAAYTDARPGLRAYLEDQAFRAQLEELRERGQIAVA
jgi:hypothetical protein